MLTMRKSKAIRSAIVVGLGLALVGSFQNCGRPISLGRIPSSLNNASDSGGGNGEGYGGMQDRAGLYYHVKPNFSCAGSAAGFGIAGKVEVLIGSTGLATGSHEDACTGVKTPLDLGQVGLPPNNKEIITVGSNVFVRSAVEPNVTAADYKHTFAHCQTSRMLDTNPTPQEQSRDLILKRNSAGNVFGTLRLISKLGAFEENVPLAEEAVTPLEDVTNLIFEATNFRLQVSKADPNDHKSGILASIIEGQTGKFRFDTSCVYEGE